MRRSRSSWDKGPRGCEGCGVEVRVVDAWEADVFCCVKCFEWDEGGADCGRWEGLLLKDVLEGFVLSDLRREYWV